LRWKWREMECFILAVLIEMAGLARARRLLLAASILAAAILAATTLVAPSALSDEPPSDAVGAIDGDAIAVTGPMSVDVVHGQVKTVLRSGSDVRVKTGQARIELVEGGSLTICGPAHFSVLKTGKSLTVALDTGTIRAQLDTGLSITVYTPQIQARPIAIGSGPQDALVGLEANGSMCIRANSGAVRVEQQLTGQSLLVPQNGDISLANGQLESLQNSSGHCVCDWQGTSRMSTVTSEVSNLATAEDIKKHAQESKPVARTAVAAPAPPVEKSEPIYQVFMPPLSFDAKSKVQSEYDPSLIVLVRRVRVRPTLVLQGRVEGEAVVAKATPPAAIQAAKAAANAKPSDPSTWERVRNYFHRLWSPSS
jgi:hypothetical protein